MCGSRIRRGADGYHRVTCRSDREDPLPAPPVDRLVGNDEYVEVQWAGHSSAFRSDAWVRAAGDRPPLTLLRLAAVVWL